jgi:hypothetical protein
MTIPATPATLIGQLLSYTESMTKRQGQAGEEHLPKWLQRLDYPPAMKESSHIRRVCLLWLDRWSSW